MLTDDPPRLTARLQASALIRRAGLAGVSAMLVRRGDPDAGVIWLKLNHLGCGFRVYGKSRRQDGVMGWRCATGPQPVDDATAEACLARQIDRDADLWVIEIEDRQGQLPVDEPLF